MLSNDFFPILDRYTQQSLMNEFQRTGHGPDKIDFFYLPIDFKNKCNRGYAFVNFVNVEDIVSFYNTYHEKPWKVFNSEKICVVMYARIQGKDAFLRRFENSEILGKEHEYQPLSFVSHGLNKGKPEALTKIPAISDRPSGSSVIIKPYNDISE
jgi:hypothetical protein